LYQVYQHHMSARPDVSIIYAVMGLRKVHITGWF
jgi:hypothetical protein